MANERNALAELAEQLNRVGIELCYDQLDNESKDAVRKAQRIIAELAKVKFVYNIYGARIALDYDSVRAVEACRAIAEEGMNNGNE